MTRSRQRFQLTLHPVTVALLAVGAILLVGVNIRGAEQKRQFLQENVEHREITIRRGWPWWYRSDYQIGPSQGVKSTQPRWAESLTPLQLGPTLVAQPTQPVSVGAGMERRYIILAANVLVGLCVLVVTALLSESIFLRWASKDQRQTLKKAEIVKKVKKLLALADDGKNDNMEEVLAATKKVDVLLAKHGLTMADVAAETGEADGPSE